MTVRPVDQERSRIVLVGTPQYDDKDLPDIPQVARNLADLFTVFTDPKVGGFPSGHCRCAPPDASVDQVGNLIEEAAGQAEDLLLFYYAGHGLIGAHGELFLALRGSGRAAPATARCRSERSGTRFSIWVPGPRTAL